jgi:hypothetical protein
VNVEGWYVDPYDSHEARWFSDGVPTALVRDSEVESHDPPPDAPYHGPLEPVAETSPEDAQRRALNELARRRILQPESREVRVPAQTDRLQILRTMQLLLGFPSAVVGVLFLVVAGIVQLDFGTTTRFTLPPHVVASTAVIVFDQYPTTASVQYSVPGHGRFTVLTRSPLAEASDTVYVSYDPTNPREGHLVPAPPDTKSQDIGNGILGLSFGVAGIAFLIWEFRRWRSTGYR